MRRILAGILVPLDRAIDWLTRGNFALKDVFTLVNLLCGVASIIMSIEGNRYWASLLIMIGYVGGDVLDGPIARLTGRLNDFGGKLDTIADHTAQCVAPAAVVYLVFQPISPYVGFALAGILISAGTIRHARSELVPWTFDLCWKGLPRPTGSFIILGFLNSTLFIKMPGGIWVGAGIVVLVSVFYLLPIPFLAHHGRRLQPFVVVMILLTFATTIAAAIFLPKFFWDLLFFWMFGYACTSWIPMSEAELKNYFSEVRRWRAEVRRRLASRGES